MNDRLLSEQEIDCCIENNFYDRDGELSIPKLLKAQLAKSDKEWVEWIVIEATIIRLGDEQNELANGDYVAIPAKRWQSRRKEIGL